MLWRRELRDALPTVPALGTEPTDAELLALFDLLLQYGIVRMSGVGTDPDITKPLANLIGPIRETSENGYIYEVKANPVSQFGAATPMKQHPHTDDPYQGGFKWSSQHLDVEVCDGQLGWLVTQTGRPAMRSPGRPPIRRDVERAFWVKIAERGRGDRVWGVGFRVIGSVGSVATCRIASLVLSTQPMGRWSDRRLRPGRAATGPADRIGCGRARGALSRSRTGCRSTFPTTSR